MDVKNTSRHENSTEIDIELLKDLMDDPFWLLRSSLLSEIICQYGDIVAGG